MKIARLCVVSLLWLSIAPLRSLHAAALERSISPSRQFIIYGGNVSLRGAMGDLAERTKSGLLTILQKRDEWNTPIILNIQFRQANVPEIPASQLHVSQTGMGLKLQLDLTLAANVDTPEIQRDLLRAILVELIYRNHSDIPAGSIVAEAPPWLIDGVLARSADERRQTLNDLLSAAAESKTIVPLTDFLVQKPEQLEAEAQRLYRAYAAALLQFLLEQPAGAARLAAYIDALASASNDPLFDLRSHFPSLSPPEAVDALWQKAVARFASTTRYDFLLSFGETQRQLDQLLQTPLPNAAGHDAALNLDKLGSAKPTKAQAAALRALSQNLLVLAASAHPLLRPIVTEYQESVLQILTRGKNARLSRRLAMLKETRTRIASRMSDMDDYMNWFEATQLQSKSGAFNDYLKAAAALDEPEKRRRDALSVYLDAAEAEFQN